MKNPGLFTASAIAFAHVKAAGVPGMDNLVAFGDSFTDEGRLGYFLANNGSAPPPGTLLPASNETSVGGFPWGRHVANATGASYYNYAVAGAVCSNEVSPRWLDGINDNFPSVLEYEVPAFAADTKYKDLYPDRREDNTVYALWIGTNDLGWKAFLSDSQAPGASLSTYVDCIWDVYDGIYETGGRNFVLLKVIPLELIPLYAGPELHGTGDSRYWNNKTAYNMTEYQNKMFEYTTSVNTMFDYGAGYNLIVEERWPGANVTVFDVYQFFSDIYHNPDDYLTAPANVTGHYEVCSVDGSECGYSEEPRDSFLW